jgi:hypothetical protein
MNFRTGILNLTNWAGNVMMPTLAALFIALAVIEFSRANPYSRWAYAALAALMVSGLLRSLETFTKQLGWNDPDLYWNSVLNLVNWIANVILPIYGVMHVTVGSLKFFGIADRYTRSQLGHTHHFLAAMLCLSVSGVVRFAEFLVAQGTGGVS